MELKIIPKKEDELNINDEKLYILFKELKIDPSEANPEHFIELLQSLDRSLFLFEFNESILKNLHEITAGYLDDLIKYSMGIGMMIQRDCPREKIEATLRDSK